MYGKLFQQMYDGTLATTGPWQALVTFQQLVILSDEEGIVDMTADAIIRRTTLPAEVIRVGLAALEQPDPQSRTPDEDGRRIVRLSADRDWGWRIVNYAHYRAMRSQQERRDYMRTYQRQRRAKINGHDAKPKADRKGKILATRLGDAKWQAPDEWIDWAVTVHKLDKQKAVRISLGFRDYWIAKPGKDGCKLDWQATWRNWVRKECGE